MNRQGTRSSSTYLSPVLLGVTTAGKKDGLHLLAEVATGPGTGVLRRIEVRKPEIKADAKRQYPWVLGFGVWNHDPVLPTLAHV